MNIDGQSFAAFRRGLPLDDELRDMIDSMVKAAAFREGGASEFVDLVLDNMRSHLASGDGTLPTLNQCQSWDATEEPGSGVSPVGKH